MRRSSALDGVASAFSGRRREDDRQVAEEARSVDQMLRMAMPDAKIAVSTMGTGTFLLTGTVASPAVASPDGTG